MAESLVELAKEFNPRQQAHVREYIEKVAAAGGRKRELAKLIESRLGGAGEQGVNILEEIGETLRDFEAASGMATRCSPRTCPDPTGVRSVLNSALGRTSNLPKGDSATKLLYAIADKYDLI